MFKRVISRISLSTFVLATGLFLWSNINQSAQATLLATETVGDPYPCLPGYPNYPDCVFKKKDKKEDQ